MYTQEKFIRSKKKNKNNNKNKNENNKLNTKKENVYH